MQWAKREGGGVVMSFLDSNNKRSHTENVRNHITFFDHAGLNRIKIIQNPNSSQIENP